MSTLLTLEDKVFNELALVDDNLKIVNQTRQSIDLDFY